MVVALIGATGLVGEALVNRFVDLDEVTRLETITRKNVSTNSPKIKQNIFKNLSVSDLHSLDIKADVFICALGTTIKKAKTKNNFKKVDYDLVLAFAELAQKNKAQALFVVSAKGANKNSMFFYNKVKGEMEESLKSMSFKSLYLYRPSLLIGERKEYRAGEKVAIKLYELSKPIMPNYVKKILGTKVSSLVSQIVKDIQEIKKGAYIIEPTEI